MHGFDFFFISQMDSIILIPLIHTIEQLQVLYTCDDTLNNIKLIPTYKLIAAAFMAIYMQILLV